MICLIVLMSLFYCGIVTLKVPIIIAISIISCVIWDITTLIMYFFKIKKLEDKIDKLTEYKHKLFNELEKQCWKDKTINHNIYTEIAEQYKGIIDEKVRMDIHNDIQNVAKSFYIDLKTGKECDSHFFEIVRKKMFDS